MNVNEKHEGRSHKLTTVTIIIGEKSVELITCPSPECGAACSKAVENAKDKKAALIDRCERGACFENFPVSLED